MLQHLLLKMVASALLVLGAPVTLALRAMPASRDPRWPGTREWIHGVLHSRVTGWFTHSVTALVLFVGSLYAMYFTGLFELALRSHIAHLAMLAQFLAVGYLFFWTVIGADPAPRRPAHPVRMLLIVAAMILHAILGVVLMQASAPLAADWFTQLARPWGPSALEDQRTGGGIAWSFGELPTHLVLLALFAQWSRADEREQRRIGPRRRPRGGGGCRRRTRCLQPDARRACPPGCRAVTPADEDGSSAAIREPSGRLPRIEQRREARRDCRHSSA